MIPMNHVMTFELKRNVSQILDGGQFDVNSQSRRVQSLV